MSARASTPAQSVAELAAAHWPRFWPARDAAGAAADVLARLRTATARFVGLVCSATSGGTAVVEHVAWSDGLRRLARALR